MGVGGNEGSAPHFTSRQADILDLIAMGRADKEIAYQLGISHRTVRTHLERLFRIHGWSSRAEAASRWAVMNRDAEVHPFAERTDARSEPGGRHGHGTTIRHLFDVASGSMTAGR